MEDELEGLIDRQGLERVLRVVSEICFAKSEHVRENWQDVSLARAWETNGRKIERLVETLREV